MLCLSADDCFQLGKVAYNNEDFYHALKWFDQALSLDDIETNKTTVRHVILDYLSFSVFKVSHILVNHINPLTPTVAI